MTSPLLALFVRSLREDARLKMTYAARLGLIAVVAVFMGTSIMSGGWTGAPGLEFFGLIAQIQVIFITLAGLSTFASAITEEKEEDTLGLLRMTDLNPLSILLGKSTSRLCGALLLLAAPFPFTLLAVTLGGVSTRQIVASYLVLGAYTFFLCNLALLASILARRTGQAAVMIGVMLVPTWFLPMFVPGGGIDSVSASIRIDEVLTTGFDGALVGRQFVVNVGLGVLFFLLAWLLFDRCCAESGEASVAAGGGWLRRRFPPGRAWTGRALMWKDAHFIHGGRGVAWLKFVAYGLAVVGGVGTEVALHPRIGPGDLAETLFEACGLLLLALLAEIGFAASRIFNLEVRDQTLSSLILVPDSFLHFHYSKGRACLQALIPVTFWSVACFVAGSVVACFGRVEELVGGSIGLLVGGAWVSPSAMFFFHFIAWLSLKLRRGALPLGVGIILLGLILVSFTGFLLVAVIFFFSPILALIFANDCRTKVLTRLDELAAES